MLCMKCQYGCLDDHVGFGGAIRCARREDSVGKQVVSGTVLIRDGRIVNVG